MVTQLRVLFPARADWRAFVILGRDPQPSVALNVFAPLVLHALPWCECDTRETDIRLDCDAGVLSCIASGCAQTPIGCDLFWAFPCDGTCYYGSSNG